MERKEFIKICGLACLGGTALTTLLESCAVPKTAAGTIENSDLLVALSEFEAKTKGDAAKQYKRYIIVHNDALQFPICVYRFDAQTYSALWMRCTHQGAELQVFGDKLQCPAHGSEFDNKGNVNNGPAETALKTFPVRVDNTQLRISLKAV